MLLLLKRGSSCRKKRRIESSESHPEFKTGGFRSPPRPKRSTRQSQTHIVIHNFHCGEESAGIWVIQLCIVGEVGQGEVQCEIPGCWFWCSCGAPGCNQRGEGWGISYQKKAVFTFKTFLLPALLKGTLNNLFPSDFLWTLLLGELPLRWICWNEFVEMNLAKWIWHNTYGISEGVHCNLKRNARERVMEQSIHFENGSREGVIKKNNLGMNHQNRGCECIKQTKLRQNKVLWKSRATTR